MGCVRRVPAWGHWVRFCRLPETEVFYSIACFSDFVLDFCGLRPFSALDVTVREL